MTLSQNVLPSFLLLCFVGLFLPLKGFAQDAEVPESGITGTPRIYKIDTRSIALGSATVAEPHSLASININPAALSFVRNPNVIQLNSWQSWGNNTMLQNFTFPAYMNGPHHIAAQFGYHHRGFSSTNLTGGASMAAPDMAMYQADFAYAYSFQNLLSIGIFNNISFAQNDYARFWSYFANLGVLYAPSESISYGITLRGLGRSIRYELHPGNRTLLGSQDLGTSIELGTTLRFPVESGYRFLSLSLANEKRMNENGIWYKGGLEIKPMQTLALRAGMIYHPESRTQVPRFGLGFIHETFSLDYSFSHRNLPNEYFHQLGITIHL